MKTKTCTRCKTEKPAAPRFFYRSSATRDGLDARCSDCIRETKSNAYRRGAPMNREFMLGDVWEVERDGRTVRFRVCSACPDPRGRELRVIGMIGRRRTTFRAVVLRESGKLVARAEEAAQ